MTKVVTGIAAIIAVCIAIVAFVVCPVSAFSQNDTIVGHWIQVDENVQDRIGTEIIVLEDGVIIINIGDAKEKKSKWTITPYTQLSGTIKSTTPGNYYANVVNVADPNQATIVIKINVVKEQKDPDCEARIIPEHIETPGLTEQEENSNQQGVPTSYKFPVRVNY